LAVHCALAAADRRGVPSTDVDKLQPEAKGITNVFRL
jgi:hypothetical protein